MGRWHLLKYSIHLLHMSLPPFLATKKEKSAACVYTMPRGIAATCIVSGEWGGPRISPRSSVHNKNLSVFPSTMTELNQKLTKSMPRRCSIRAIYTKEKYLCTNLEVKEEGGHLLERGPIFWGIYTISVLHEQSTHHISLNNQGRPRCYANSHPLNRAHFSQNCMLDYRTNCDLLCIRQCATCALHVLTLLCNNSTTVFSSNTISSSFVPSASSL